MNIQTLISALLGTCLVVGSSSIASAQTTSQDGGSVTTLSGQDYRNWSDGANWTSGNPGDAIINDGFVYSDPVLRNFYVGSVNSTLSSLQLNGGTLQMNDDRSNSRIGDRSPGVVTQSGGNFFMHTGTLVIGSRSGSPAEIAASSGLYDISGGTLSTSGGEFPGGRISLVRGRASDTTLGGGPNEFAASTGELRISGTAVVDLSFAGSQLGFGDGNSILSINGSNASISFDTISMVDAGGVAETNNHINFTFDDTGVSTINVTGDYTAVDTLATAALAGVLDLNYTGSPLANGTTFDLLIADAISLTDFSLDASDTASWSLSIVGDNDIDGGNGILQITSIATVPEPSSSLLLGLAGVVGVGSRRRRS